MYKEQVLQTNLDEFSRCEERMQMIDHGKSLSPIQKTDAAIKESVNNALWKDDVLRALEYYEIDVHVKNGVVYLNGHIVSTASQSRIKNAIRYIPGILEIKNNLVLDDKLTSEVAGALGKLEHTFNCKFFTGVSHGVVVLNGEVSSIDERMSAEQCAASHPKVRCVLNYIRIPGVDLGIPDHRFLQPSIGKKIYFRDGVSGTVRQVIINPDNRRVVAVTIQGSFDESRRNLTFSNFSDGQSVKQLLVIPKSVIEHVTKNSGFLTIQSTHSTMCQEFDASMFSAPNEDWLPPYPYCPDEVLFPVEYQQVDKIFRNLVPKQDSSTLKTEAQVLTEELLFNDSIGG
jgi:osmotically-inducible protein OsmY